MLLNSISSFARRAFFLSAVLLVAACGSPEERAQGHYERGIKLMEQGDYTRASLEIRNALKLQEDMAPAWVALSKIEEHSQNWEAVNRILRRVVSLDAKDVESRLRLARILFLARSNEEALKLADATIALDPKSSSAHSLRAAILFRRQDAVAAVNEAETALLLDPKNTEALIVLAADRVARKDTDGALAILNRAGPDGENNFAVQLFRMKVFETRGDLPQIESILQRLIELNPKEAVFRRELVRFYLTNKRPADAEKQLRTTASADPANAQAGLDVVRFLQATKGDDAARQELVARGSGSGNVFPYQIALAEFYAARGKTADAIQLLESIAAGSKVPENTNAANVKLAEIRLSQKKPAEADAIVEKILAQDRRNIGALKLRSVIQMDRGQYDSAIANLREALNDQPRDSDLLLLLASAFERSGSMELADERLAYATRISNFDPRVGLQYVSFLRRRGNEARAEDVLKQLAGRSPSNHDVLMGLAQSKLGRQDWAGAQAIADDILRIGTNTGLANQILGEALAGQQKLNESINVLEAAREAQPEGVESMFALVRAYMRAQKLDEAEAFLKRTIADNPSGVEAKVLLGTLRLARNQPEEAEKMFVAVIKDQPKSPAGYRALAALQIRQGKSEEAMKSVRAGLAALPEDAPLRLTLAQLFEMGGKFDAAIVEYEILVQQQPGSLVFANNLASLLLDHRTDAASLDKASALAARLRKSPVPHFKDTLGWLHYRRGEYKASIALLEEAAKELPNLPVVHYHLGLSYLASGEPDKGVERLKRALELVPNGGVTEEAVRAALKKAGIT